MTLDYKTELEMNTNHSLIMDTIKEVIKDEDIFMSENTLNNITIHLTIVAVRLKAHNYIPLSTRQIEMYTNENTYNLANKLCQELSKKLKLDFPQSEIALVAMYLSQNNMLDFEINSSLDLLDDEIFDVLRETFYKIKKVYDYDFTKDNRLYVAIGLHLTSALQRLENDNQIENPLVDQIKQRHELEFNFSRILNECIKERYHKEFTDDELAYFVLHFVVSINGNKNNA